MLPLILIGLDTGDPGFIEQWANEGYLPTIAALMERGCWGRTGGPELISEHGTWVSIFSGLSRGQHGYSYFRQLKPGTYDLETATAADLDAPPFWSHLSTHRIAVIDAPEIDPIPGLHGIQLAHWAPHGNWNPNYFQPASEPPELLQKVQSRFGNRLVAEEIHESTWDQDQRIYNDLLARVEQKGALCKYVLAEGPFDLSIAIFTESHAANHQFWRYHPANRAEDKADHALTHAIRDVYQAIDRQIGQLLALLPTDANVFIISSVGMEDAFPAGGLIEAFSRKLGYQATPAPGHISFRPIDWARRLLPESWRLALSRRLPRAQRERLLADQFRNGTDWSRTKAFALPTSYTSFVRVNLRGREPEGTVAPGAEYEALLDQIEADLKLLVDPETNTPAVARVARTRALFGADAHPALPDLFVDWKPGRFMRRVVHPRAELTQDKPEFYRRSDHRDEGFVLAAGPNIAARGPLSTVSVLDLAPTWLALLGVPPPADMPGQILEVNSAFPTPPSPQDVSLDARTAPRKHDRGIVCL